VIDKIIGSRLRMTPLLSSIRLTLCASSAASCEHMFLPAQTERERPPPPRDRAPSPLDGRGRRSRAAEPAARGCATRTSLRRGSPKYEQALLRWLERYLTEGSPRLQQFAARTSSLAKLESLRERAPTESRAILYRLVSRSIKIAAAAVGGFLATFGLIVLYWALGFDQGDCVQRSARWNTRQSPRLRSSLDCSSGPCS